jgi:tetratricopeptide (TPR) repeat protein
MGPKWLVDPVAFAEMIPPDAELSFLSGMSLKRRNQHQAAVKRYAEIIATHPDCYPAYLCEGISCGSLQEYATARTLFQEAEKLRPDISAAYEQEGWCFYREHNLKRAVQCFDKAIKISPLPNTYVWLATCYQDMRKPREMMELFKKSVNFPDTTGYTDLALAQVALDKDHVDDALNHIHDALQKAPNDSVMYACKAACLCRQKKLDEALELYTHAALIDPYQPAYQDYIAQVLSQISRHDEAIAHFRKAIVDFRVDSPFAIALVDSRTGDILFMGAIYKPH